MKKRKGGFQKMIRHTSLLRPLYTIAILLSMLAAQGGFAQPSKPPAGLTEHQKLARDIFKQLIEINTSLNVGCTKAAEAMAERLKAAGFAESDMFIGGPEPSHKNLVVRYRGKGTLRPILLIGHLDVVDALRDDWSFDPFIFLEKDGYFYGRGTTDMKSDDADFVANFIRLKKDGFVPSRDIILALTEDEENGDANGVQWLLANHRDLIDAEYCINPDVGGGDLQKGKPKTLGIQTSEKVYVSFQLEVKNKGGHSSRPVRENAIYRLAAGLTRLSQYDFPIRFNETTRAFFERTAKTETGQTQSDLLAILKSPDDTAASIRLAVSAPHYNALLRTTWVPTMLSGGHAENALPQSARAVVNCRLLPDDSFENVQATLHRVLADSQIFVTRLGHPSPGPLSPLRKDVMDIVENLAQSMWPGVTVTPVMSTGASDGKLLRQVGIPVYGISGMFADIDDVRAHGKDERLGVKEFYDGVDFMYKFIKALTR
jgi:acetylornithine deacetylase/succinyl-diaminopimelate desuccinylase-like protein